MKSKRKKFRIPSISGYVAKWIKCRNCNSLFTITISKNKKGLMICPKCKSYNYES